MSYPSVIFVSGRSNSGKTTLIERLIPKLREQHLRVGTMKHAHEGFEMDRPGKDSWRHRQAGASAVALIAPKQAALLVQTGREIFLDQAIEQMSPYVDLILVEGYKNAGGPKILLGPPNGKAIDMNGNVCHIGVQPDRLTPEELEWIVKFLLVHAKSR